MCWNKYVSLNTFLFSFGMLLLMIYNNTYSPYKLNINYFGYFFIFSFISMQLIEYFLWKKVENRESTYFLSLLGQALIVIQPIASLLMMSDGSLKTLMITLYLVFVAAVALTHKKVFKTTVENNHLKWTWVPVNMFVWCIWAFFLLFSFLINKHYVFLAGAIVLNVITLLYASRGTGGSLWCWSVNVSMLTYAVYLLLYAPFQEIKAGNMC